MIQSNQTAAGVSAQIQTIAVPADLLQEIRDFLAELRQQKPAAIAPKKGTATRPEAADFLNCSTKSVDRMVNRGELKPVPGFRWPRFAWADLERINAGLPATAKKR